MSVVEEQAKELSVGAAGGAKDGGQKRDTMIVSVGMLILIDFLLGGFFDCGRVLFGSRVAKQEAEGGFAQRLVDVALYLLKRHSGIVW